MEEHYWAGLLPALKVLMRMNWLPRWPDLGRMERGSRVPRVPVPPTTRAQRRVRCARLITRHRIRTAGCVRIFSKTDFLLSACAEHCRLSVIPLRRNLWHIVLVTGDTKRQYNSATFHDCTNERVSGNNARLILKHGTIDFFLEVLLHKNRERNE